MSYACTLPWPPSVNTYYTVWKGRKILSKKAKQFKLDCIEHITGRKTPLTGELRVHILVCMPDKRRRDLDNLLKPILDVLGDFNIYDDDSQISDLRIVKTTFATKGTVRVHIEEIE